jgi:predicted DNA-binding transcriptional regulator AlpA
MQEDKDDTLPTTPEMAALLGVKPATLEVWRATRRYPLPYVKIGRLVKYRKSAGLKFIASRTVVA